RGRCLMVAGLGVLDGVHLDAVVKSYRTRPVLNRLSFDAHPGRVTALLGPNGAGKTTSLRVLLGLVRPDSGVVSVLGRTPFDGVDVRQVASALEGAGFHPGRTARNHLRLLAGVIGCGPSRVDEVLGLVGLAHAANKRVGTFSLGMKQRLSLAHALLPEA